MKNKFETYIHRTKADQIPFAYDLYGRDCQELVRMVYTKGVFDAIYLAFLFGRAKGIRYARKEARRV